MNGLKLLSLLFFPVLLLFSCGSSEQRSSRESGSTQAPQAASEAPAVQDASRLQEIRTLLPEREGYSWFYQGFAEYGHHMKIADISETEKGFTYSISGRVSDPSGGAAEGDYTFTLSYRIENGALIRHVPEESKLMDDDFPELTLIRVPLEQGTEWVQTVENRQGEEFRLVSRITEVTRQDSAARYHVEYRDASKAYTEERVFEEGKGLVRVSIPWEDHSIGYSLIRSGYSQKETED